MLMLIFAASLTLATFETIFRWGGAPLPAAMAIAAVLFGAAAFRGRGASRVLAVNVALGALIVLGFEVWVEAREPQRDNRRAHKAEYTDGYMRRRVPERGYGPTPNHAWPSRKEYGDEVFYEVTYTIDEHGLRVTPPSDADTSILFFGGSYTFGEGLNDSDTFPYRVGEATRDIARVHNFGFHGYGPHQMLATLNGTFIDEVVTAPPRAIVFLTAAFHIDRVTGRMWDRHGPRFRLNGDGSVYPDGTFADLRRSERIGRSVRIRASKTALGRRVLDRFFRVRKANFDLYVAIVAAARDRALERYPESRFDVLVWDRGSSYNDRLIEALEGEGMTVHRLSEVLPGLADDAAPYAIHEFDGHPNSRATELISDYVLRVVLGVTAE